MKLRNGFQLAFIISLSFIMLVKCQAENSIFKNEIFTSGLIPIDESNDSLFYILLKSRNHNSSCPLPYFYQIIFKVIIYICGGPGSATEFSIMMQNGPYIISNSGDIILNPHSLNNKYDVLYVDQPIGVGFSIAYNKSNYCTNRHCIGKHFNVFIQKFYLLHPEYKDRPFFIGGVSYAGHYVPAIVDYLLKMNDVKKTGINFRGSIIVSPWTDALIQMTTAGLYGYNNGFLDLWKAIICTIGMLIVRLSIFIFFEKKV